MHSRINQFNLRSHLLKKSEKRHQKQERIQMFERTHHSETEAVQPRSHYESPNVPRTAARRHFKNMHLQVKELDRMRGPGSEERLKNNLASPVTQAFNSFVLFPIDKAHGKCDRTS